VLLVCAGTLWVGGAGSLQAAQRVTALSGGRASAPFACEFKRDTGHPCPGCGGTAAFEHVSHGEWTEAAAANPLGAFAGLAAWVLAAASLLTLTGAGTGWLRRTGAAVLVLLPAAFVANAAVWFISLPPGALR
jgi:hypothetical protein